MQSKLLRIFYKNFTSEVARVAKPCRKPHILCESSSSSNKSRGQPEAKSRLTWRGGFCHCFFGLPPHSSWRALRSSGSTSLPKSLSLAMKAMAR